MTSQEKTIHDQFSRYGQNAKEWMRKCVLMLPKIQKKEIWRKAGFNSIYEYAAKIAGMSRSKVDEALRVLNHIKDKPALQKVIAKKGLQRVRPVATIATPETDQFWAEKALTMSKHTLETYVRDYRQEILPGEGNPQNNGLPKPKQDSKIPITMKLDPATLKKLQQLKGTQNWNDLINQLLTTHQTQKSQLQKELQSQKPAAVKSDSHYIPKAIQNYVKKRAQNQCEHPNCTKPGQHLHHTTPFALKHEHDPDKIRYLCKEHHDLAHHGLTASEEQSPENWQTLKHPPKYDIKNTINLRVAQFKRR